MVFKNKKLNTEFSKNGYVVLKSIPFQSLNRLVDFYNNQYGNLKDDFFHTTHFVSDVKLKRDVHLCIKNEFASFIEECLDGYTGLFGNFMIKPTGTAGIMPLHADWTYVKEPEFVSCSIWCPMNDTNEQNGTLGVVPKSHLFDINFRGPQIPSPFHLNNEYIINNYGTLLPIRKGEAVVYDHRLLHFSPPNLSNNDRLAINLVCVPKKTVARHYYLDSELQTLKMVDKTDEEFYLNYEHFKRPNKIVKEHILEQNIVQITKEQIDSLLNRKRNGLFRWFN